MYGMLLESIQHFIQLEYGEEVWNQVVKLSKCKHTTFNTHQVYPDSIMWALATACAQVNSATYDDFMSFFGKCFVRYFTNLGYDISVKATGRYFADFLQNIDNIHTQFCFTYPKMKSPSFYLTDIDKKGCVLVYRSGRHGFTHYVMGQLYQVAKDFFQLKLDVQVLEVFMETQPQRSATVKFRLNFDNSEYIHAKEDRKSRPEIQQIPTFPCAELLQLFPFAIMISPKMIVNGVGEKLVEIWTGTEALIGYPVTKYFRLRRPKGIEFTWRNLYYLRAVMFELELIRETTINLNEDPLKVEKTKTPSPEPGKRNILFKGQMKHIDDVNSIIFLCSPVINDLDELPELGLYLNDLNHHGLSKEMVLAGWQHNSRLEELFDKAESRSDQLEKNFDLLETWKQRGDELLYTMLPKIVADRLRNGESSLSTCETFESVTIMFCETVGLQSSTVKEVMDVVTNMNTIFSFFDELMDKYNVYKVETVGQIYMVASGAPERTQSHAENIADLSLDMISGLRKLKLSKDMDHNIRIGLKLLVPRDFSVS